MSSDSVITANAATVRKVQFCQRVKMTAGAPAQIAQATARYEQSKLDLKRVIDTDEIVSLLGSDYSAVKAEVDAL
jgi:hypothetical protein